MYIYIYVYVYVYLYVCEGYDKAIFKQSKQASNRTEQNKTKQNKTKQNKTKTSSLTMIESFVASEFKLPTNKIFLLLILFSFCFVFSRNLFAFF